MDKQFVLRAIMITALVSTAIGIGITPIQLQQWAYAYVYNVPDAPIVASGSQVYVTWATNKTGNWEIMFRASNDNGATFGLRST